MPASTLRRRPDAAQPKDASWGYIFAAKDATRVRDVVDAIGDTRTIRFRRRDAATPKGALRAYLLEGKEAQLVFEPVDPMKCGCLMHPHPDTPFGDSREEPLCLYLVPKTHSLSKNN